MRRVSKIAWLRPGSEAGMLVLAGVIGVGAGLGAAVLIYLLRAVGAVTEWVGSHDGLTSVWMFATIPVGMFLAWTITALYAPEVAGHGVPQIIAAIAVRGGSIRPRVVPLKTLATALTIGSGGSAGREGSIAQIGAGIGSSVSRWTGLGEPETRALVAAGAGAGIAATFNAPIAGMFFALEVILGDLSIRYLHTVVVATVAGAVVSHSVIGDELTFIVSPYGLDDPWQLALYAAVGLVAVALAIVFIEALARGSGDVPWLAPWMRPIGFGLVVAAIGYLAPEVLGTSQEFIGDVLRGEVSRTWWIFGLLAVAKLVATSLTLGGRGAGGIFMPSLFIGATAGSAFAALIDIVWTRSPIETGAFALVGMAATFSAVARAPLTSILIVFEITGDYGLVMPLMIAVALATFLANRFHPLSAYTEPLIRMGIHNPRMEHVDLLDTVTVGDLGIASPITVGPEDSLAVVQGILRRHRMHGAPVVADGALVGVVTESDILRAGGASDQVTARDAMTRDPYTVTPDMPISETLERMATLGVGRLPVVAGYDPTRLVGMFRREDAINAYHLALGTSGRQGQMPERVRTRRSGSVTYHEIEIGEDSSAVGRAIKEIPWPEGCLVVSIHRGNELLVASGDQVLQPGDALTVFSDDVAHRRLKTRLKGDR